MTKAKPMNFEVAWTTDIGRRRSQNQDFAGAFPDHALFIVADGMGGHRGGEVASKMAVEIFSKTFAEGADANDKTHRDLLSLAAVEANQMILEKSRAEPELEGMGTTTTAMHFHEGQVLIGHVGDSRCYLVREDGIWQLTRDHSLVQEKLRAGMITRAQLKTDRMKNVITRSVGFDLQFGIDVYEYHPHADDVFLMCSDGLTGQLEDSEILAHAQADYFYGPAKEPKKRAEGLKKLVDKLILLANERGGDDNITVLMVHFLGAEKEAAHG